VDEDHRLLLQTTFPLLRSRNTGVVLAVASLYHYIGTQSPLEMEAVGKALVRVMRNHVGIEYVLLSNIAAMAASNPGMFRKHLKDFYVWVRCVVRAVLRRALDRDVGVV
jgi:AP-3 complex subunit beta